MALVVTFADNGDGTATATVAGSAGGLVAVQGARLTSSTGPLAWAVLDSRLGDGDVTFAATPGLYVGRGVEAGLESPPYYFAVTTGAGLSVATRVRNSITDRITALALPCSSRVFVQVDENELNLSFPCTVLSPVGLSESRRSVVAGLDDIGRPTRILILDRADRYDPRKLPDWELWRQTIERAFHNQRMPGVIESFKTEVDNEAIVTAELPKYQYMVSQLVIRAWCRERRGFGA